MTNMKVKAILASTSVNMICDAMEWRCVCNTGRNIFFILILLI